MKSKNKNFKVYVINLYFGNEYGEELILRERNAIKIINKIYKFKNTLQKYDRYTGKYSHINLSQVKFITTSEIKGIDNDACVYKIIKKGKF